LIANLKRKSTKRAMQGPIARLEDWFKFNGTGKRRSDRSIKESGSGRSA